VALANTVSTALKVRYQRSVLGFLWTLLNPLLTLTVMTLVFSVLLNRPLKSFTVYLFAGLVPWQFYAGSLNNGAKSLISNQSLIRKMFVPKLMFPISELLVSAINLGCAMAALFLLLQFIGASVHPQLVLLPVATLLLMMFTLGLGLMLMVLNTFYRDLEHVISVILRMWFYMSPVFWYVRDFEGREGMLGRNPYFDAVILLNPMTHFLEMFHCIFRFGRWPGIDLWAPVIVLAVAMLLAGYVVYKRYEDKLIFRL
jgi:ABC-2 type transport system permease protein/lipopolysaccharide transport system permease protein